MQVSREADVPGTPATTSQPVKMVLQRRARPGLQQAFEAWIRSLMDLAARSPDLQGSSVLTAGNEYFILLRFGGQASLDRWMSSPDVTALLREADVLATAEEAVTRSGLETWFTLPGLPRAVSAPPKWKMAVVTWFALVPQVAVLGFLIPEEWPTPVGLVLGTAIPVCLLTWVLMPWLSRRLHRWLYVAETPT